MAKRKITIGHCDADYPRNTRRHYQVFWFAEEWPNSPKAMRMLWRSKASTIKGNYLAVKKRQVGPFASLGNRKIRSATSR